MSWIEVESKIKVEDVVLARKKVKEIAKFVRREHKIDEYYTLQKKGYPEKSLRVRKNGNKREVNFKEWMSYKKGVHVKKEVEFDVSDVRDFFELLGNFGFRKWLMKDKKTELYEMDDGIHIELNNVKGLGWFIEIEILCRESAVNEARKKIIKIRKKLGFGKKNIEKRGYTKLLWKRRDL